MKLIHTTGFLLAGDKSGVLSSVTLWGLIINKMQRTWGSSLI